MATDPDLRQRVNVVRSSSPGSDARRLQRAACRRWTRAEPGALHRLMRGVRERTGCPVLVNTSFNVRGEPIVCTPEDAYRCFLATEMDVLVLEDVVLLKEERSARWTRATRQKYLAQFQLDIPYGAVSVA